MQLEDNQDSLDKQSSPLVEQVRQDFIPAEIKLES